jgi:hypothetical protein
MCEGYDNVRAPVKKAYPCPAGWLSACCDLQRVVGAPINVSEVEGMYRGAPLQPQLGEVPGAPAGELGGAPVGELGGAPAGELGAGAPAGELGGAPAGKLGAAPVGELPRNGSARPTGLPVGK